MTLALISPPPPPHPPYIFAVLFEELRPTLFSLDHHRNKSFNFGQNEILPSHVALSDGAFFSGRRLHVFLIARSPANLHFKHYGGKARVLAVVIKMLFYKRDDVLQWVPSRAAPVAGELCYRLKHATGWTFQTSVCLGLFYERSLMVRWVVRSILHGVDPLSYLSFQPVLHNWCK